MPKNANIDLIHKWITQIWNQGNLDSLNNFHPTTSISNGQPTTIEAIRQWHVNARETFPDVHYKIDDIFTVDDRVAVRWTATGTHHGMMWGFIPPTQKSITWQGIHMLRIADNKIVDVSSASDSGTKLQQIGVTIQPPSEARNSQ